MYNAWLDLFIKLPCFGLFREGQREGAAWEAAAFCKGLFNYLPGDWLHGHPVHLGDAPRVRVRGGGQPKGQSQSPGPRLAWGSGRRTPLRSKRGVDRRLGRAPFCRCRRGGGGKTTPPTRPSLAGLPAGSQAWDSWVLEEPWGHSGPLLSFSAWKPLPLGRSLPHTLLNPALKAIPAPQPLGSCLGVVSDSCGDPCPRRGPASEGEACRDC